MTHKYGSAMAKTSNALAKTEAPLRQVPLSLSLSSHRLFISVCLSGYLYLCPCPCRYLLSATLSVTLCLSLSPCLSSPFSLSPSSLRTFPRLPLCQSELNHRPESLAPPPIFERRTLEERPLRLQSLLVISLRRRSRHRESLNSMGRCVR